MKERTQPKKLGGSPRTRNARAKSVDAVLTTISFHCGARTRTEEKETDLGALLGW